MIATELAARYANGESLSTLAHDYGMNKRTVAKTVRAMGVTVRPAGFDAKRTRAGVLAAARKARERRMASGGKCARCEILLRFDPGQNGFCGECWEEVT